jgi:hypothetical protein
MLAKAAVVAVVRGEGRLQRRQQSQLLTLIENLSLLHRTLLPVSVWCAPILTGELRLHYERLRAPILPRAFLTPWPSPRYTFFLSDSADHVMAAFCAGMYLAFKVKPPACRPPTRPAGIGSSLLCLIVPPARVWPHPVCASTLRPPPPCTSAQLARRGHCGPSSPRAGYKRRTSPPAQPRSASSPTVAH